MPNGKPGDHPLTDLLAHGKHRFPPDMEEMILRLLHLDPRLLMGEGAVSYREWADWEAGRNLDAGRAKLKRLLAARSAE